MVSAASQEMQLQLAITAQLVDIDEITSEMQKKLTPIQRVGTQLSRIATAGMVGAGAALGGVAAATIIGVKSLIAFEDAFAGVRKTVDADTKTLEFLSEEIRRLATEVPIAANELARIGELGGQLGIGAQNLTSFIETVAKLGVATVLSTEQAALALARLAAIANIPDEAMGDFFERTASSLVDLGNNFAATEDEIITTVLRIATAAEQTGASTADALAFATALQAIGVPAQAGGTAISRVFQEIERAIQNSDEQLQLFAAVAGVEMSEFAQLFGTDAAMAVSKFIEGLETAGDRGIKVQDVLKKLNLSQRRTQLAINGLAASGDLLSETLTTSRNAFDANIALNVEAAKKFTTTAQQIVLLKNQIKELTMEMAERWLPTVRRVVFFMQSLTQAIDAGAVQALGRMMFNLILVSGALKTIAFLLIKGSVAAGSFAAMMTILQGLMNPATFAIAAVGIASVITLFRGLKNEILALDIVGDVGARAFAGVISEAEQFGTGTAQAMEQMIEKRRVLQEELDKFTAANPNMTDAQKSNAEALRKDIEFLDQSIENLGNSIKFVVDTQIEKLAGSGGNVGDLFGFLSDMRTDETLGAGVNSLLENILVGGKDPKTMIDKFFTGTFAQHVGTVQAEYEQALADAGVSSLAEAKQNASMSFGDKEVARTLEDKKAELDELIEIQNKLLNLESEYNVIAEESAEIAARKVLTVEGEKNINKEMVAARAVDIKREREQGFLIAKRFGISEDILLNTEFSGQVAAANAKIEAARAAAAREDAKKTLFELTEREIAIEKVEMMARKSSESIVSLFQNIPDQVNMTASEVVRNLQDQAMLGAEFMQTIQALNEKGFIALAGMLAQEGPKALKVAQEFLTGPSHMAEEAERRIAQANLSFIQELTEQSDDLGKSDSELRDAFFGTGVNLVDGVAEGIRSGEEAIRSALEDTVNAGIEGFQITFQFGSPSVWMANNVGLPLIDGVIAGIKKGSPGVQTNLEEAIKTAWANLDRAMQSPFTSDDYLAGLATTKGDLKDTFKLFTNFSSTLANIGESTLAVTKAERNLEKVRKNGIRLTKDLSKANEELADAIKKYGNAGVTTDFERLGIMRERLSLINMEESANKRNTASERLAIKDAKREVQFMEQAVRRGVKTEDDLQAAREALAEMTGTTEGIAGFKDAEAFEEKLQLQNDILALEIKFQKELIDNMKKVAGEESEAILDLNDKISEIQDQITDQVLEEEIAQQKVIDAMNAKYDVQLKLFELADKLIDLGPEGEEAFRKIAKAVGMPEAEINALIGQAREMGKKFSEEFTGIAKSIWDIEFETRELAILPNALNNFLSDIDLAKSKLNDLYFAAGQDIPFPDIGSFDIGQAELDTKNQQFNLNSWDGFTFQHSGGMVNMSKKAMVGEFGPEIISVTPAGTRVTPTGIGRSGGISVENVIVNVTGVPSDPQSARKAAMSIRKALVNLEKEGSSSSILGR